MVLRKRTTLENESRFCKKNKFSKFLPQNLWHVAPSRTLAIFLSLKVSFKLDGKIVIVFFHFFVLYLN